MYKKFINTGLSVLSVAMFGGRAFAGDTLKEVFAEGKPYLQARYRYEHDQQDGLPKKANASTVRTVLGYKSGDFHGFKFLLEFENVAQVGEDTYNDTLNGKTDRPTVADVTTTEFNQGYVEYSGIPDTAVKGGRQVILLDGQRFVGPVGWRQNDQTFDAATIVNTSLPDTVARYGYIYRVNRIFGNDSPNGVYKSDSHFVNVSNTSTPLGKITAYGYLFDFKNDAPTVSSQTYGISLSGKIATDHAVTFQYYGEYAYQSDYGQNPTNYHAHYYHVAPGVAWKAVTLTAGYEVLGSDDGAIGFSTPLATGHKFNGWADVFLTTPAKGLEDIYIDLASKVAGLEGALAFLNGLSAEFQFHNFSANNGGDDYGKEWGIFVKQPLNNNMYAEVKYADYNSDGFASDRQKIIFDLGLKF